MTTEERVVFEAEMEYERECFRKDLIISAIIFSLSCVALVAFDQMTKCFMGASCLFGF